MGMTMAVRGGGSRRLVRGGLAKCLSGFICTRRGSLPSLKLFGGPDESGCEPDLARETEGGGVTDLSAGGTRDGEE